MLGSTSRGANSPATGGFTSSCICDGALFGAYFNQSDSFDRFVNRVSNVPVNMADRHFKSQCRLLYSESPKMGLVGKIEQLDKDFALIANRCGFSTVAVGKIGRRLLWVTYIMLKNIRSCP